MANWNRQNFIIITIIIKNSKFKIQNIFISLLIYIIKNIISRNVIFYLFIIKIIEYFYYYLYKDLIFYLLM